MITSEEKLLSENIALNAQNLQTTIIISKNRKIDVYSHGIDNRFKKLETKWFIGKLNHI